MRITQKPADVYANIKSRLGEFGYAAWDGFAYTHGHDGAIMLIAAANTMGKFMPDGIELYVPDNSMYTTQGYCQRNSPYELRFDIASGGKSVAKGKTYIYTIGTESIEVQKGVAVDKDGHCTPLGGMSQHVVNKEKAKEALKIVRERLIAPFAAQKLLGTTGTRNYISDENVLKAIVANDTARLVDTSFVTNWRGLLSYEKETRNFINRYKTEIYHAFGALEPEA